MWVWLERETADSHDSQDLSWLTYSQIMKILTISGPKSYSNFRCKEIHCRPFLFPADHRLFHKGRFRVPFSAFIPWHVKGGIQVIEQALESALVELFFIGWILHFHSYCFVVFKTNRRYCWRVFSGFGISGLFGFSFMLIWLFIRRSFSVVGHSKGGVKTSREK